jgi:hypothetical protein
MKKKVITLLFCIVSSLAFSQVTTSFTISGKVKSEKTIAVADLEKMPLLMIGDVVITNHKGETKGTARNMKGVRLRDVLRDVELDTDNPKLMSEYYFVAAATDGYRVVFSWNELFNSAIGETVFVVVEKDGKKISETEDSILTISSADFKTGRRFVKNLSNIIVGRANQDGN